MNKSFVKRLRKLTSFDFLNYLFMLIFMLICFYPFWTIIIASFSDGNDYIRGGVYFWPRVFTVNNYIMAFNNVEIVNAIGISFARTIIGTVVGVLFTSFVAYGMTLKDLKFINFFYYFNIITMFIGGGVIPFYVLMKQLKLLNSFWVYIIPTAYSVYNMIIISNFFREIPNEIRESAVIDGAGEFRIYASMYIPLSKAVLATVALWVAVGHWNSYYDAMMYTTKTELQTLQLYLVKLIKQSDSMRNVSAMFMTEEDMSTGTAYLTIRYATMAIATIPVLCVYPLVQKHFAKGIMLGSVKG